MSEEDRIQDLLHFDALSAAEKLTGQSYKEDEGTMGLGFLMHIDHNERKSAALKATGDTFFSSTFAETRAIYARLGFEEVLETHFEGKNYEDEPVTETSIVLWRVDGVLGRIESYLGDSLNTNKFYYNWRPSPELLEQGFWEFTSSGHLKDGVWVGDHDGREGMGHNLIRMEANGEFVAPWIESPFLWFATYEDVHHEGYDYKAINAAVIAQLPAHVREGMGL